MKPLTTHSENSFPNFYSKIENHHSKVESESEIFSKCRLDDLFYLEYSAVPIEDDELTVCTTAREGFYFLYCERGELEITLANGFTKKLTPFKSSLIYDKDARGIQLKIRKNEDYHFSVIGCDRPQTDENFEVTCFARYRDSFCDIMPDNYDIYTGKPSLKLTDRIEKLSLLFDKGISSQLIMRGCIYEIFGIKLEQMFEVLTAVIPDNGSLTTREILAIKSVTEFIRKDSSKDFTIEFLCRQTGLSPAKLQEGFKKMYDSTVINYIRNRRLEKAAELIESTDLNISEIVYSIGLTSRSYFSKIFRNRYNCSPKFFQDQNKIFGKIV